MKAQNNSDMVAYNLRNHLCSYIDVCNQILSANAGRFPYAHIWRAMEGKLAKRSIMFSVVDMRVHACVYAQFLKGQLEMHKHVANAQAAYVSKAMEWHYLNAVLENPTIYIANPALIDWDWISGADIMPLFKKN